MANDKPNGYIFESIPKGPKASIAKTSQTRVTQTVKSALQNYLQLYLDHNGLYRHQLELTASFSIQYETRITAPEEQDPTIYEVQLARYWNEIREKLPCILLVDSGFNYINPGLGGAAGSAILNRSTSSMMMKMDCSIPMTLSIAAQDETTAQDLRDILVYIFGVLTSYNNSYIIKSKRPEDTWEVRLPFNFDPEGIDNKRVTDDNKDSIWLSSITILPEFEGTIYIGFEKQVQEGLYDVVSEYQTNTPGGAINDLGNLVAVEGNPKATITVPNVIYLNNPVLISAPFMPAEAFFASDDPKIALIEDYKILPKRPGTFNLYLMDKKTGDVIQEWVVSVKPQ